LPHADRTAPSSAHRFVGPYRVVPTLGGVERIVYYVAYHVGEARVAFVIAPDALAEFVARFGAQS